MKKLNYLFASIITLFSAEIAICQTNTPVMVEYNADFVFTDGIYPDYESFKNNKPIEKSRIVSSIDPEDMQFFDKLTEQKTISVYDGLGNTQTLKTEELKGYCSGGSVYIFHNGYFNRVGVIGAICHFLGSKTYYYPSNAYPDYGYGSYGMYTPGLSAETELQQYIMIFETGDILEYNSKSLGFALMTDPLLHDEFSELSGKKKNARLFLYVRKFNEKHPVKIPVYE